jgi:hypothetical protein
MERLTERQGDQVNYVGQHTKLPGLECASTMRVAAVRDVMDRLAAYEDTGLTPEGIRALLPLVAKIPNIEQLLRDVRAGK